LNKKKEFKNLKTRSSMTKIIISISLILNFLNIVFGQGLGPMSGAQPKSFSTLPNNLGFLANSVNQATGQVQFSMPVLSLAGRGNLSYALSFNYSSANLSTIVNARNREQPTGILGLGWSIESPKIIVDHKNTGTRKDDEFYLVEGGASLELFYNTSTGNYYTKNYTNWIINYNESQEKWTITKEDGSTYVYGDINSARKTIRYVVKWGNWIGNSSQPTNQAQMAHIWDISEINDLWGDKIMFEYQQDLEYVAAGNAASITSEQQHTKASYLKEVKNLNNERITFSYISKVNNASFVEYKDIHNERPEPDAYQEKYESLALDRVGRYDENGSLLFETRLGYGFLSTAEMAKRTLTSITQYNSIGNSLPGFSFSYESLAANNFGALLTVTSPLKGTTNFVYSKIQLMRTSLTQILAAEPSGTYQEPRIFFGEDYVVITRRKVTSPPAHNVNGQPIVVDVLTWDGGTWIIKRMSQAINLISLVTGQYSLYKQDFNVVLGKDFFAIVAQVASLPYSYGSIHIYKKNEFQAGEWYGFFDNFSDVNGQIFGNSTTLLAGNDFVFLGSKENYIFNNFTYSWDAINFTWQRTIHAKVREDDSQFFYTVANNYFLSHQDVKRGADRLIITYKASKTLGAPNWVSTAQQLIGSTSGNSSWYGSNSYAVMMAAGGNERIYYWDENYRATLFDVGYAEPDDSHVVNMNNSMALIANQSRGLAWRFDGANWIHSGILDFFGPNIYLRNTFSVGEDFIFRPRIVGSTAKSTMRSYDPATRSWSTPLDVTLASNENPYSLLAGYNFVTTAGKFFFKNSEAVDSWIQDPTVFSALSNTQSDYFIQGGLDFVVSGISNTSFGYAVRLKNGVASTTPLQIGSSSNPELIRDRPGGSNLQTSPQVSYNTIVTALGGVTNIEDASSFKIYRKIGDNFEGSISSFAAIRAETFDAIQTRYTTYDYAPASAAVDPSGSIPFFNRTRMIPGSNTPSSKPQGYTDFFFFNGLSSTTLSALDPNAAFNGNINSYYKAATGTPYNSYVFNMQGQLLSSSSAIYSWIPNGSSFYVRTIYKQDVLDNRTVSTSFTYSNWGLPNTKAVGSLSEGSRFYNEVYSGNNLFVPVQTRIIRNFIVTDVSSTRWKSFGSVVAPCQTYSWKGGSTDFSLYWDSNATVPSNWRLVNTNVNFNSRGLLLESIDGMNVHKSIVYHSNKPLVLAEVSKATSNQILYESFEYTTDNTSTTALTGLNSYTASYTVNLPSAGSYKLTYWRKVGSANWEFINQTITGNIVIGGGGTLIDEIRLCPVNALMTTYCYDRWNNLITICDANNQISYFEFDEFNRPKLVRDENNNIVSYKAYNIKN